MLECLGALTDWHSSFSSSSSTGLAVGHFWALTTKLAKLDKQPGCAHWRLVLSGKSLANGSVELIVLALVWFCCWWYSRTCCTRFSSLRSFIRFNMSCLASNNCSLTFTAGWGKPPASWSSPRSLCVQLSWHVAHPMHTQSPFTYSPAQAHTPHSDQWSEWGGVGLGWWAGVW